MTYNNTSQYRAAYTVSIEAAEGVTTGVSALDHARTIQVAVDPTSGPKDIVMPGHTFPIEAQEEGLLVRRGHTEGSYDLMRCAGLKPAAVICEIMNADGTVARMDDLRVFAEKHHLKIASIQQLLSYRLLHEILVEEIASARLPSQYGHFIIKTFKNRMSEEHPIALIHGNIDPSKPTLVRVHSECLTGDIFGSVRCDCAWQLQASLERIGKENGVLVYLRQEGRGIGLANKIKAYALQDEGLDTVEANHRLGFGADERTYDTAVHILKTLGVKKVRLLTNNPEKMERLRTYGIEVTREPIEMLPLPENREYLRTKRDKLHHLLETL